MENLNREGSYKQYRSRLVRRVNGNDNMMMTGVGQPAKLRGGIRGPRRLSENMSYCR